MSSIYGLTQGFPTQVSASSHQGKESPDLFVSGVLVDQHTPLEEVFIFFDTATYDQIERDVKVNKTPLLKVMHLYVSSNSNSR